MKTTKHLVDNLRLILSTMSIPKVARASGVGEQTIRNWLSDTMETEPTLGLLIAVFQACGHPIKFSFEGLK